MGNEGRKPTLPLWVAPGDVDGTALTWADLFASMGGGGTDVSGLATKVNQELIRDDIDFRYGGGKTAYVQTIASSGNHDALTPPAGGRIRVFWCTAIPNSDNAAANLVNLGFGAPGGAITTPLYRSYALSHWEVFTGDPDEAFIIATATSEPVAVTVHYQVLP